MQIPTEEESSATERVQPAAVQHSPRPQLGDPYQDPPTQSDYPAANPGAQQPLNPYAATIMPNAGNPNGVAPHRGTLIMMLGIVGIAGNFLGCCCFVLFPAGVVLSIPAIVMGGTDLKKMAAGEMDQSGYSQTNAGRTCGIVGVCFGVIGFLLAIVSMVVNVAANANN